MRLSTWARTDTSSALTGSSASRIAGRGARPARSRSAAAVRRRTGAGSGGPPAADSPTAVEQLDDPAARIAAQPLGDKGFGDDVAHSHAGVERPIGSWNTTCSWDRGAARSRSCRPVMSMPSTKISPLVGRSSAAMMPAAGWTCRSRTRPRPRSARRGSTSKVTPLTRLDSRVAQHDARGRAVVARRVTDARWTRSRGSLRRGGGTRSRARGPGPARAAGGRRSTSVAWPQRVRKTHPRRERPGGAAPNRGSSRAAPGGGALEVRRARSALGVAVAGAGGTPR